jgi:hypothetical protein
LTIRFLFATLNIIAAAGFSGGGVWLFGRNRITVLAVRSGENGWVALG